MQTRLIARSQRHQESVVSERLAKSPPNPTEYEVGDYVLISYTNRPPSKLTARWRGPLLVIAKEGNTYDCQDLCTLRIQRMDISRLKLFQSGISVTEMKELAARDSDEFVVEFIVDHRNKGLGKKKFLKSDLEFKVRWLGYDECDDSWIPYSEAKDLEALDLYLKDHVELHKLLGKGA